MPQAKSAIKLTPVPAAFQSDKSAQRRCFDCLVCRFNDDIALWYIHKISTLRKSGQVSSLRAGSQIKSYIATVVTKLFLTVARFPCRQLHGHQIHHILHNQRHVDQVKSPVLCDKCAKADITTDIVDARVGRVCVDAD